MIYLRDTNIQFTQKQNGHRILPITKHRGGNLQLPSKILTYKLYIDSTSTYYQ